MPKAKVLVIEDNPVLVRFNEVLLKSGDYVALFAEDGEEGIRLAVQEKPDVILLDLILPKRHGFEVYKDLQAKDETKNIPVIIVTGSGLEEVVEMESSIKVSGVLTKPYDFNKLEAAISKALTKTSG